MEHTYTQSQIVLRWSPSAPPAAVEHWLNWWGHYHREFADHIHPDDVLEVDLLPMGKEHPVLGMPAFTHHMDGFTTSEYWVGTTDPSWDTWNGYVSSEGLVPW